MEWIFSQTQTMGVTGNDEMFHNIIEDTSATIDIIQQRVGVEAGVPRFGNIKGFVNTRALTKLTVIHIESGKK